MFLTTCLKLRSSNQSKPKRQLRLYLCICIPTLAQSWAFSKDYGCKDSDYLGKLYQKRRDNYDNFLNYLPKNEFICLILISNEADKSKMRQKKLLCHKFHGTCFLLSYSSHLPLSYHPMSDDLCHLPMSHVHHYTLLFKTRYIADSHTRLIRHLFTCHIFSILRFLKSFAISLAISSGLS